MKNFKWIDARKTLPIDGREVLWSDQFGRVFIGLLLTEGFVVIDFIESSGKKLSLSDIRFWADIPQAPCCEWVIDK